MPIRFRCAYCNQLMGISRHKAGDVVRCPKCSGQVVVPAADDKPGEIPKNAELVKANDDADLDRLLAMAAKDAAGISKPRKKRRPGIEIDVEQVELVPVPVPMPPAAGTSPAPPPSSAPPPEVEMIDESQVPYIVRTPHGWMVNMTYGIAIGLTASLALLVGLAGLIGFFLGSRPPAEG
jgi:DNA-directed RNA polymerase subunit RPC12/RpoP